MAAALHYGSIKLEASSGHLHVHSSNDLLDSSAWARSLRSKACDPPCTTWAKSKEESTHNRLLEPVKPRLPLTPDALMRPQVLRGW